MLDRENCLETIFLDDEDRQRFLKTLGQVCERIAWRIHRYVLMGNHCDFLMETPEPNLTSGMRWFQATCTIHHTVRPGRRGHSFQGRYKAIILDAGEKTYFRTASDYKKSRRHDRDKAERPIREKPPTLGKKDPGGQTKGSTLKIPAGGHG